MQKKIVNIKTGEETLKDFTKKELADFEQRREEEAQILLDSQPEKLAREEAKQSAVNKLAALGLTPEEVAAITGA